MTQHPDQLDLEGLESAAKASIKACPYWWDDADITARVLREATELGAEEDAVFIGLASPTTALSILSRLRASEAECVDLKRGEEESAGLLHEMRRQLTVEQDLAASQALLLRSFLDAHDQGPGLLDQIDNDGERYTSLHLVNTVEATRLALASTRTPAGSDEARPDAGAVGGEGV